MDISGAQPRAARAAFFTALVVTLSAGSHVLLSRAPLPLSVVAALAAAVFGLAYASAGRERCFRHIAALLVPLELAADTVFTTGQQVCYGPAGGPVTGPLRSVGFDVLCGGAFGGRLPGVAAQGGAGALLTSPDPVLPWLLLGVHVSVGLLASFWLRRGEAALAGLLRTAALAAFRPLLVAVAAFTGPRRRATARRTRPAHPAARRPAAGLFAHSVGRRGPPEPVLARDVLVPA